VEFWPIASTTANAWQPFLARLRASAKNASAKRTTTTWPTLAGTPDVMIYCLNHAAFLFFTKIDHQFKSNNIQPNGTFSPCVKITDESLLFKALLLFTAANEYFASIQK